MRIPLLGGLLLAIIGSSVAALLMSRRDEMRYQRLVRAAESLLGDAPQKEVRFSIEEFAKLWQSLRQLFERMEQRDQETRTARAQLQAVLDAATEVAVIAADDQGLITVFNKGAEKLLGYSAEAMLGVLRRDPKLVVGDDQPYSAKDNVDYTIRRHGRDRGLPHVMVEVRNDLLRTVKDIAAWTERLTGAIRESAGVVGLAQAGVGA